MNAPAPAILERVHSPHGQGPQPVHAGPGQGRGGGIRLHQIEGDRLPRASSGLAFQAAALTPPGLEPQAQVGDGILHDVPVLALHPGGKAGVGPVGHVPVVGLVRPEPHHPVPGRDGLEQRGQALQARAVAEDPEPVVLAALPPVPQGLLPGRGRRNGRAALARASSRWSPWARPRRGARRRAGVRSSPGTSSPRRSLPAAVVAWAAPQSSRAHRMGLTGSPRNMDGEGSTTSHTISSRLDWKVLMMGSPVRAVRGQLMARGSSPGT